MKDDASSLSDKRNILIDELNANHSHTGLTERYDTDVVLLGKQLSPLFADQSTSKSNDR